MDVKSAFLNGKLKEEVYFKQPPGFESSELPNHVCKLDKSLYELKQAPRAWYETLSTYLTVEVDNTLFVYKTQTDMILVQIYVDDIIFGSTSTKVFGALNWALKPNQPKGPPFTTHMLTICKTDVHVVPKAPKISSHSEKKVPQGKKPRASNSTAETDPGKSAPNDSIRHQQDESEEVDTKKDEDTHATSHDVPNDTLVPHPPSPKLAQLQELMAHVHLLESQKDKLEQQKAKVKAKVASLKARPLYPDINQLTKLLDKLVLPLFIQPDYCVTTSMPKRSTNSLCKFVVSASFVAGLVFFSPLVGKVVVGPAKGTHLPLAVWGCILHSACKPGQARNSTGSSPLRVFNSTTYDIRLETVEVKVSSFVGQACTTAFHSARCKSLTLTAPRRLGSIFTLVYAADQKLKKAYKVYRTGKRLLYVKRNKSIFLKNGTSKVVTNGNPSSVIIKQHCDTRSQDEKDDKDLKEKDLKISRLKTKSKDNDEGLRSKITRSGGMDDSGVVEVIGIGSRKDAILDFCLASNSLSQRLRFCITDPTKIIVKEPVVMKSCSKAVILVAGASYGSDLTTVHDIFEAIKLANGFLVTIILKPFRFEGRRRQDEFSANLYTLFAAVIDADALLEKDLVTLDEALQIANKAVLMALNAVSILTSEYNKTFLDISHGSMKELGVTDLKGILGSYKEAKIGYGIGNDIETSVVQAIDDCPFLSAGVKDLNGVVVFILASSTVTDSSDINGILGTFRQAAEWEGDIITSVVCEPDMSPGSVATTIFTVGSIGRESVKKVGIISKLVQRFPFIFNILKPNSQLDTNQENSSLDPRGVKPEKYENSNVKPANGSVGGYLSWSPELQSILSNDTTDPFYNQPDEGTLTFQRELLMNRRPGYLTSDEVANETNKAGHTLMIDQQIYKLPVGVKPSGDQKDGPSNGSRVIMHLPEGNSELQMNNEAQFSGSVSFDESTDASLQAAMDFNSSASSRQNKAYTDVSKKNGRLSARAASMLESERESQKKWNPVVEINYRGGTYVGRCQGGLPEGKGRLSLNNGSMYDGLWRYGKRSGLGTFCFSNGDIFRGSWRDDVMHGKVVCEFLEGKG
nr:protein accumulation and replication of chloroplasts 3 isoform X1 [Tanacetum cinerariifolium]